MFVRSALIACDPECFPEAMWCALLPVPGRLGPYVNGLASMPCVCMPDSCVKAFSPTIALFGCTWTPINLETSWDVP